MRADNNPSSKIPQTIYMGLNEIIKLEKNLCHDMDDFVHLIEESMVVLNAQEKRKMAAFLQPYKELSAFGLLSGLKELNADSTQTEIMSAINVVHLSFEESTAQNAKRQKAFLEAVTQREAFIKYLNILLKGNFIAKVTGNKFKNIFTKKYAEFAKEFNEKSKSGSKALSDVNQYLNATIIKPVQVVTRYHMPITEVIGGIDKDQSNKWLNCASLMNDVLAASKKFALTVNSAMTSGAAPKPKVEEKKPEIKVQVKPEAKFEVKQDVKPEVKPLPTKKVPSIASKIEETLHDSHRHHRLKHLHRSAPLPIEKLTVNDTVDLINILLSQKFPRSKNKAIVQIREIISKGGEHQLENIKAVANRETRQNRFGFSSSKNESELRRILRMIAADMPDRLLKELHTNAASRRSHK